jgi:hypothetical protein
MLVGVLGQGNEEELRKLFMRIDANSDGTVDWDEFSSFILLENQGAANLRESESVLQFHPSKMPDRVRLDGRVGRGDPINAGASYSVLLTAVVRT